MKIFNSIINLQNELNTHRSRGNSIGFVPTMGALHQGHLSLIHQAKSENDIAICSIFVNPTQFDNPTDLLLYPRQENQDIALLELANCDILFLPSVEEMYPADESTIIFNFGSLEQVMEGKNRKGHFQGVGTIVKKLFEIVMPNKAYFGKKDYQQWLIIQSLITQYQLSPQIIGCEIVRESDDLAMSSRNQRLSQEQRALAPNIYKTLKQSKELYKSMSVNDLISWVELSINEIQGMKLVYFELGDANTLMPIKKWTDAKSIMAFIVVQMGDIRLIDNIQFF